MEELFIKKKKIKSCQDHEEKEKTKTKKWFRMYDHVPKPGSKWSLWTKGSDRRNSREDLGPVDGRGIHLILIAILPWYLTNHHVRIYL